MSHPTEPFREFRPLPETVGAGYPPQVDGGRADRKGEAPEELRTALTALAAGEALVPPEMLLTRFEAGAARPPYRRAGLRAKAWQVETCCGVGLGLSSAQMGQARHVTEQSARNAISAVEQWLAMDRKQLRRFCRHALAP